MKLNIFKSKIHRATITMADLHYNGSIAIDKDLLAIANIKKWEAVHVWNVTSGTRLVTYAIEAPAGSGQICINGAAAHLNKAGDIVIIATFAEMTPEEADLHDPTVILVDEKNKIIKIMRFGDN